ncbi:lipid A biosynthesis acyltransferase [Acinetobacter defluvii]|uniref:Lysophospholipid acyltransferase family protein n=1 Tax=Acinetobacter defluvii TaxID=1871111 RepID=A0A2S2FCA7_9GAMM|nr:lysophospholipid acyltransferase family protein [Acinetobacter defluvii]AWL28425.1 lysophospholipid acyltransferase family protein [Acinetobacter defluvii]NNP72761.1 lipid A biosynthesis acyltransferase [Acinetobacter defluvii]
MTEKQKSSTTRLLHFFGRQPILFSRFYARILAGIVNLLHVSKTSKTIRLNIEICLPQLSKQERERITRAAIRNELQSYMEFFTIWGSSTQKNISRIRQIHGEHLVHEALAEGKGLVLIVPHFGTWEIMNAWVAQHTQMTIMYKPIKNADADDFVREARSREQANLVPTDESGVRQIFKALKQGGTTVILPDHTPHVGGEMIDYFGIPLASSNLSAKLIQKTKAKALLLYAIRNESDDFDMFIEPINEQIYQGSANDGTHVIHQALEHLIERFPQHYHWSYKRFKAHPQLRNVYTLPKEQAITNINRVKAEALSSTD